MTTASLYGLLAEFPDASRLVAATHSVREQAPDVQLETYAPFGIPELTEAPMQTQDPIARWTLAGALLGGLGTFGLEWYSAVIDYPLNVGGRPTGSWPAFLSPAIEMTLLGAAVFGVFAMLRKGRLPRFHHPLFNAVTFQRVTSDRFFLVLKSADTDFDADRARALLRDLAPLSLTEIMR